MRSRDTDDAERTERDLFEAGLNWTASCGCYRNLCIACRGVDVAMNGQRLDDADVGAIFQ